MRLPLLLTSAVLVWACSGRERPPGLDPDQFDGGGSSSDSADGADGVSIGDSDGCEAPPTIDSSCGSEIVPVLQQKPNIYFVLDLSGSMVDAIAPGKASKISAAKNSIIAVATDLGHRVRYGLGVFPGPDANTALEGCGPGEEAFATREGDPIICTNQAPSGPVLTAFTKTVRKLEAVGGTPLAASLTELAPKIKALEGPTAVILLTDGAPNCNMTTLCAVSDCMLNLTESVVQSGPCVPNDAYNCCDPALADETGVSDPLSFCIDGEPSVAAVADLLDSGVPTYVIGVPGVEVFTDIMNRLAEAGGTARDGAVGFYDASDTDELTDTLRTIGGQVAQSCEIELKSQPGDPDLFNVYFDAVLVPRDAADGWTLDKQQVTLHGDACDRVKTSQVSEIQMVTGCTTVVK